VLAVECMRKDSADLVLCCHRCCCCYLRCERIRSEGGGEPVKKCYR